MSVKHEIISILEKNRNKAVSGQELADSLNVSRAAVWKAVKTLKDEGYYIEAIPNKGYILLENSDVISSEGIACYLDEKIDIYAPAEKVYCLMPEDTYTYSEGVSISVAYVTGTIALAKSINPTLKCEEIKNRLHRCYNEELNIPVLDVKKICIQE